MKIQLNHLLRRALVASIALLSTFTISHAKDVTWGGGSGLLAPGEQVGTNGTIFESGDSLFLPASQGTINIQVDLGGVNLGALNLLAGDGNYIFEGGSMTFSSYIYKHNSGDLELSSDNILSGRINVYHGTLVAGSESAFGTAQVRLSEDTTVRIKDNVHLTGHQSGYSRSSQGYTVELGANSSWTEEGVRLNMTGVTTTIKSTDITQGGTYTVQAVVLSENGSNDTTLTIGQGTTLNVIGEETEADAASSSFSLGNMAANNTINIAGTLSVASGFQLTAGTATINIEDKGHLIMKEGLMVRMTNEDLIINDPDSILMNSHRAPVTVNMKDGSTLTLYSNQFYSRPYYTPLINVSGNATIMAADAGYNVDLGEYKLVYDENASVTFKLDVDEAQMSINYGVNTIKEINGVEEIHGVKEINFINTVQGGTLQVGDVSYAAKIFQAEKINVQGTLEMQGNMGNIAYSTFLKFTDSLTMKDASGNALYTIKARAGELGSIQTYDWGSLSADQVSANILENVLIDGWQDITLNVNYVAESEIKNSSISLKINNLTLTNSSMSNTSLSAINTRFNLTNDNSFENVKLTGGTIVLRADWYDSLTIKGTENEWNSAIFEFVRSYGNENHKNATVTLDANSVVTLEGHTTISDILFDAQGTGDAKGKLVVADGSTVKISGSESLTSFLNVVDKSTLTGVEITAEKARLSASATLLSPEPSSISLKTKASPLYMLEIADLNDLGGLSKLGFTDSLTLDVTMSDSDYQSFLTALQDDYVSFIFSGLTQDQLLFSLGASDIELIINGYMYDVMDIDTLADGRVYFLIPEPSTATLSLLALSALLMRRRRAAA